MDANSHHSPTYDDSVNDIKKQYFRKIKTNYITKLNKDVTKILTVKDFIFRMGTLRRMV